jgi:hypothetical protein
LSVQNIMGAAHDVWSVNVEEEYHEEMGRGAPVLPKRVGAAHPEKIWSKG